MSVSERLFGWAFSKPCCYSTFFYYHHALFTGNVRQGGCALSTVSRRPCKGRRDLRDRLRCEAMSVRMGVCTIFNWFLIIRIALTFTKRHIKFQSKGVKYMLIPKSKFVVISSKTYSVKSKTMYRLTVNYSYQQVRCLQ